MRLLSLPLLLSSFLLLATIGCRRDEKPAFSLPPVTQTGANTFGFIVDGRVWRDYGVSCDILSPCDSNRAIAYTFRSRDYLFIKAGLSTDQYNDHIELTLHNVHQPGVISSNFNNWPASKADLRFDTGKTIAASYIVRRSTRYQVSITRFDTVQHFIAGTFAGTFGQLTDSTKTVTISDGRFDLHYH